MDIRDKIKRVNIFTVNKNLQFIEAKLNLLLKNTPSRNGEGSLLDFWERNDAEAREGTQDSNK